MSSSIPIERTMMRFFNDKHLTRIILTLFCLALTTEVASADMIFPLAFLTLPFFPFIVIIEILVFATYAELVLVKVEISFRKIFIAVFAANMVSSAVGLVLPSHSSFVVTMLSAFLLSTLIESPVYAAFIKVKRLELLKLSFLSNLASYAVLIFYFVLRFT